MSSHVCFSANIIPEYSLVLRLVYLKWAWLVLSLLMIGPKHGHGFVYWCIGSVEVWTHVCVVVVKIIVLIVMLISKIFASSLSGTWPLRSCVLQSRVLLFQSFPIFLSVVLMCCIALSANILLWGYHSLSSVICRFTHQLGFLLQHTLKMDCYVSLSHAEPMYTVLVILFGTCVYCHAIIT